MKFIVRSHPFLRPLQKAVIVDIASNGFEVTGALAHLGSCAGCSKDKREGPWSPRNWSKAGEGEMHISLYNSSYCVAVLSLVKTLLWDLLHPKFNIRCCRTRNWLSTGQHFTILLKCFFPPEIVCLGAFLHVTVLSVLSACLQFPIQNICRACVSSEAGSGQSNCFGESGNCWASHPKEKPTSLSRQKQSSPRSIRIFRC